MVRVHVRDSVNGEAVAELQERKCSAPDGGAPTRGRRVKCERCRRTVGRGLSERMEMPFGADEPTAHVLCPDCADEVRRGLLRLLAGQEPVPAPAQEAHKQPATVGERITGFLVRMAIYALLTVAVFALVSWLLVR